MLFRSQKALRAEIGVGCAMHKVLRTETGVGCTMQKALRTVTAKNRPCQGDARTPYIDTRFSRTKIKNIYVESSAQHHNQRWADSRKTSCATAMGENREGRNDFRGRAQKRRGTTLID